MKYACGLLNEFKKKNQFLSIPVFTNSLAPWIRGQQTSRKGPDSEYFRLCRQLPVSAVAAKSSQRPCTQAWDSHVPRKCCLQTEGGSWCPGVKELHCSPLRSRVWRCQGL